MDPVDAAILTPGVAARRVGLRRVKDGSHVEKDVADGRCRGVAEQKGDEEPRGSDRRNLLKMSRRVHRRLRMLSRTEGRAVIASISTASTP